jgi:hypothetical protein
MKREKGIGIPSNQCQTDRLEGDGIAVLYLQRKQVEQCENNYAYNMEEYCTELQ